MGQFGNRAVRVGETRMGGCRTAGAVPAAHAGEADEFTGPTGARELGITVRLGCLPRRLARVSMERHDLYVHRVWLIACCAAAPLVARADTIVHMKSAIYGCEKAPAARALNNRSDARQNDPRWVAYVMGDGQCVRITTQSPWAVIGADEQGVTLVAYRGTVGRPGSFYVPTSALDFAAPLSPPEDAAPVTPSPEPGAGAAPSPSPDPSALANGDGAPDASNAPPAAGDQTPSPPVPAPQQTQPPGGANPSSDSAAAGTTPQQSTPVQPPTTDQDLAKIKADIAKVDPPTSSLLGPVVIFFVFVAIAGAAWLVIVRRRAADRESLLDAIKAEIAFNTQALRVKRLHTARQDEFGSVNWDKWVDAKSYYLRTRVQPIAAKAGFTNLPAGFAETVDGMIEAAAMSTPAMGSLDEAESFVSSPERYDPHMDPHDYEIFCALQLQRAGWDTRTTVATGDQGADVIAKQHGKSLVVQCKLYSNPVGNDAVQQVHAAKTFQAAQFAAVVSNQPFTRAARQLASVNGVYLLHHDELQTFRPFQLNQARYTS